MPCRCDIEEPSARERESQRVNQLLILAKEWLGQPITEDYRAAAKSPWGAEPFLDKDTDELCSILKGLKPAQRKVLLDFGNRLFRPLATWWDNHQEADRQRKVKQRKEKRRIATQLKAMSKLTKHEQRILGLR